MAAVDLARRRRDGAARAESSHVSFRLCPADHLDVTMIRSGALFRFAVDLRRPVAVVLLALLAVGDHDALSPRRVGDLHPLGRRRRRRPGGRLRALRGDCPGRGQGARAPARPPPRRSRRPVGPSRRRDLPERRGGVADRLLQSAPSSPRSRCGGTVPSRRRAGTPLRRRSRPKRRKWPPDERDEGARRLLRSTIRPSSLEKRKFPAGDDGPASGSASG